MKNDAKIINHIQKVLFDTMQNKGISFKVNNLTHKERITITIEPYNYKGDSLDGMQILFEKGIYEVAEYQAGPKQNELHIFLETKSFKVALKNMLKGNKRKPIKIWN
jgi:hypothetical protein